VIDDNGMHHLRKAQYRVDWADWLTEVTADTHRLVYQCDPVEAGSAELGRNRLHLGPEHLGELSDGLIASRWAEIYGRGVAHERLGIRAAARKTALSALNTRQHLLDARDCRIIVRRETPFAREKNQGQCERHERKNGDTDDH
jgi:hypothetical protein